MTESICPKCGSKVKPYNESGANNIYTLAYTDKHRHNDEQITYLIDENKKLKFKFYDDGYEGVSADYLKGILDFLGIKYFECVYNKFPSDYYKEYKDYDWRTENEII